ncbi:MAG: transposase, partial [Gammaproteobacteria bacterium]|nr:transposase [Gammaproteobacteria bacterium]
MTTPRKLLVDPVHECDYHLASRCVRRSHLCGFDAPARRDFSHRRTWLPERLRLLVPAFAVDLYAYAVMSNHFHLAVRHDPLACRAWDDDEVAARWLDAFPPTVAGAVAEELKPERRELMLGDPGRVARARATLGSLSHFMKHL